MKANPKFCKQAKSFWAYVRTISQQVGYTAKKPPQEKSKKRKGVQENKQKESSKIKVPTMQEIVDALSVLGLDTSKVRGQDGKVTEFGQLLHDYFSYRAQILNDEVPGNLMNAEQAKAAFEEQKAKADYKCPFPNNKQKENKKAPAYLTGMVNMIVSDHIGENDCNYDPRTLTTVTRDKVPIRTLARRVDGAFPRAVNPIAVWEVKEYYYTTSFGSRIADGIYETMLDGMELEELQESERIEVKHYLMIDGYKTWWEDGRSYLCRIVDMLHMGYVDEVLIGREIPKFLPDIVKSWLALLPEKTSL